MKIVFASNNAGKIRELQNFFASLNVQIIPQTQLNVKDIEETGMTFVENAILKARHASSMTGLPAIADDSGLSVDILNGEPGIYSARYAGLNAASKDNIEKLLHAMEHVEDSKRCAGFYCALVFLNHPADPTPLICTGSWQGMILKTPTGTDGFGYDPVFFDPTLNCSAAQLTLEKKNQVSHRAKALNALVKQLQEKLCLPCQSKI